MKMEVLNLQMALLVISLFICWHQFLLNLPQLQNGDNLKADSFLILKYNLLGQKIYRANVEVFGKSFKSRSNNQTEKIDAHQMDPLPPPCPEKPTVLKNKFEILLDDVSGRLEAIENEFDIFGGRFWPLECTARHKVAIIIPYRDRERNLRTFLANIHNFLNSQFLDYGIFVIEQNGHEPFNRGMLLNVGVAQALQMHRFKCFVFHDVDLLPEDNRIIYDCPDFPRHLSVTVETMDHQIKIKRSFDGVTAMRLEHFHLVNGFSNRYWGKDGLNKNMEMRLANNNLSISRYPDEISKYKYLDNEIHKLDNGGYYQASIGQEPDMSVDGFNSLNFTLLHREMRALYSWVLVDLHGTI